MKKICLKALLLCCGFLLFNCQNDDPGAASKQDHFEISIERKNFKEFHDLPALVSKHIGEGGTDNLARNNNSDPLYDFEIDSTSVTQIVKEGKTYYTMAIYRAENIGNSFENLVISNDGAENTAHIVKYFPSQEYLQSFETNDHAPFIGEINITPLNYSQLTGRGQLSCYTVTMAYCGNGPAGTLAGPGCYKHSDGGAHVFTRTYTVCKELPADNTYISPDVPQSGGGSGSASPTTPIVTEPILFAEFQFVNGLSAEQKAWWNNPVNLDEKQELINYIQDNNSSAESKLFAKWAIDYLRTHPTVTIEQLNNWFMIPSEGKDGDYDASFWESPTFILQQKSLPSMQNFLYAFPKIQNGNVLSNMPSAQVYQLVGGSILSNHLSGNGNYQNACSIRGSRALNYSGLSIPVIRQDGVQKTEKGGDSENYILSAKAFNKYMNKTFGPPTYRFTFADIGGNLDNIVNFLQGKNGIYTIINKSPGQAGYSGHVDIIINGQCLGGANANPPGGVEYIEIWQLN